MKTIGIVLREWRADVREIPLYAVRTDLIAFLRKYKINAIAIPVIYDSKNEFEKIKEIIDFCDGIIFPGGKYIKEIDLKIMKYLYEQDKPTFGICLGMQIMGATFNGGIRETIKDKNHNSEKEYVHEITIDKNSRLYEIIGMEKIKVNSRHGKCVPHTKLDCVAYSEDGIIEAIEDKTKKFFIGVQWHPETLPKDEYSNKIFEKFIQKLN